jgi:hypothetical protein
VRGGAREGAGRPSVYRQKLRATHAMAFTAEGRQRLDSIRLKTSLGQNDVMEHLLRTHADHLRIPERTEYSPKLYPPIAIRLTEEGRNLLLDLSERYGRSWTDVGEALLQRFGERTAFPYLESRRDQKRPRSRRRRPARPLVS